MPDRLSMSSSILEIQHVTDKLCDEAMEEGTAVACFCLGFAARVEQLLVNMYSSLLRQLVSG